MCLIFPSRIESPVFLSLLRSFSLPSKEIQLQSQTDRLMSFKEAKHKRTQKNQKKEKNVDTRGRIAALAERANQHSQATAMLRCYDFPGQTHSALHRFWALCRGRFETPIWCSGNLDTF
jgi:hypothetical protein